MIIKNKNSLQEISCGNLYLIRKMIARFSSEEIYNHYIKLDQGVYLYDEEKRKFYEEYTNVIRTISQKHNGKMDYVLKFLYASEKTSEIDSDTCNLLYNLIESCNTDSFYGFPKSTVFKDFKKILKDCIENHCNMELILI